MYILYYSIYKELYSIRIISTLKIDQHQQLLISVDGVVMMRKGDIVCIAGKLFLVLASEVVSN